MHEIDTTTGKAAIAYVGAAPWHNLGQHVNPNATPEEWQRAAGIEWEAKRTPVVFNNIKDEYQEWNDKHVLYRSDTGMPLSVVSDDYQIVQPAHVMGFFGTLAEQGGFKIETVGAIREGRRIWALARVGENAKIMDDEVAPYLLLATSYDASMATVAKFTHQRVVCRNTLDAAMKAKAGKNTITIPHSAVFNPGQVRLELGIALSAWDEFKITSGKLAGTKITDSEMDAFLLEMIEPPYGKTYTPEQIRNSKGYQRINALFHGGQLGTGQDAINGTAWGALQATIQYVDHEKGRLQDNRLDNAWFGAGAKFKNKAFETVKQLAGIND